MPYRDLREFIVALEKAGEALRIEDEVDWDLEAGAIIRRAGEAGLPAPFLQKIKGYPQGYRLFGGTLASFRRIAIAMDMNPDTSPKDLIEEYLRRKGKTIKPVIVSDGPCKENVHMGDEVDLLEFPVPMIHEGDGGRYIGTWHLTISKELDGDWVNWGIYRHMLQDKNTVGIMVTSPGKHLWSTYAKGYQPEKRPMEVAIAIGVEPISTLCAGTNIPFGTSEVDLAGGIRGEPLELIKCETMDLLVPATSEIVIEGEISPDRFMAEGPFGEYSGYSSIPSKPRPTIKVKAVSHRNNPIFTASCMGVPMDDNLIWCFAKSATFLEVLRKRGLPVTAVNSVPESSSFITIVGVKPTYPGIAADLAHLIWGTETAHSTPYLIIVEDDVDPFNMAQVLHALATKCHPSRGIVIRSNVPLTPILPSLNRDERENKVGGMAYFDCTWPLEWNHQDLPKRMSFADCYPYEIQQKTLAIWKKLGY